MARIRTIKPEFPQSESMGRVSREARLCFIMIWTICDDAGRVRGNSRMLASLLYPYDDDAGRLIDGWLGELEREGCVERYQVGTDTYIRSVNWLKHQKIDKPSPSRLPSPDEGSRIVANAREVSTTDLVPSILDLVPVSGPPNCAAPSQALALVNDPVLITLPTNRPNQAYRVLQSHFDQFVALYPAVDVPQELRGMAGWLIANPTNRKTASGTPRFINAWLSKAQNRSKPNGHGKPSKNDNWLAGAAELADELRHD